MKELGGFISVRSEPGKGSSFEIFLPVAEKTEPEMGEAYETLVMGNERILFVDDEAVVLDSGRQILELLGYEVVTKDNPVEALDAFRQDPDRFDLVITDQTMPGLTGDEFARALMEIRPEIPIVLCTGFSEVMDEGKARRMGIRAFVMKPIIMKQMADTIRCVLGSG